MASTQMKLHSWQNSNFHQCTHNYIHLRCASALAVSSCRGGLLPLTAEACLIGEPAYLAAPLGNTHIIIYTHLRCASALAVSSCRGGLLPLTAEACLIGEPAYLAAPPGILDNEERDRVVRILGPSSKVLFLTGDGALCCGQTLEEAFHQARQLASACDVQLRLGGVPRDELLLIEPERRKQRVDCAAILVHSFVDVARIPPAPARGRGGGACHQARQLASACDVQLRLGGVPRDELLLIEPERRKQIYEASRQPPADGVKWRVGGEEFEALMRMLDNAGFRTGYIYRHPLVKNDVPKPKSDVEVPPAVSSLGYLLEEEEMYKQGLWKKGQGMKVGERTRWLNSPNVYQKVEVLETGTSDPKKITKWVDANNEEWVQDQSPAHSSTPLKIDTLQFVPKNTNPKEFKALQQQIKDNRRADKISAGPQSHILEGVTWDEANKMAAEDATTTQTGDHVVSSLGHLDLYLETNKEAN
ncbi:unnamed protein product [Plutella xylostella]|uniref:(diamondback moth) hypothetical protein n=1 Tax=Plutella xylostella TaxID=51655 RepID=A0A8S4FZK4_PLUXY|nr:unnamed protein product [Plutella xylostella]